MFFFRRINRIQGLVLPTGLLCVAWLIFDGLSPTFPAGYGLTSRQRQLLRTFRGQYVSWQK